MTGLRSWFYSTHYSCGMCRHCSCPPRHCLLFLPAFFHAFTFCYHPLCLTPSPHFCPPPKQLAWQQQLHLPACLLPSHLRDLLLLCAAPFLPTPLPSSSLSPHPHHHPHLPFLPPFSWRDMPRTPTACTRLQQQHCTLVALILLVASLKLLHELGDRPPVFCIYYYFLFETVRHGGGGGVCFQGQVCAVTSVDLSWCLW